MTAELISALDSSVESRDLIDKCLRKCLEGIWFCVMGSMQGYSPEAYAALLEKNPIAKTVNQTCYEHYNTATPSMFFKLMWHFNGSNVCDAPIEQWSCAQGLGSK